MFLGEESLGGIESVSGAIKGIFDRQLVACIRIVFVHRTVAISLTLAEAGFALAGLIPLVWQAVAASSRPQGGSCTQPTRLGYDVRNDIPFLVL